jgi:hypothetical protein
MQADNASINIFDKLNNEADIRVVSLRGFFYEPISVMKTSAILPVDEIFNTAQPISLLRQRALP